MITLHISVDIRPFSINKAYMRNHALSNEARRWKMEFIKKMRPYLEACKDFARNFNETEHEVHVIINYRLDNLITATGKISHASGDVDNYNKFTLDGIFNHIPGVDDCAVTRLTSSKSLSMTNGIDISLSIAEIKVNAAFEET